MTPLQTFIHVLTQGGNLRLNMSWHLRTIPCIPGSQECETDPLTILYSAGTCHEKLELTLKRSLGRDNRGLLTSRILRNRRGALGLWLG